MKSGRGLPILTALVAAVVAYAVFDYWMDQKDSAKKADQARLISFNQDQIKDVEIRNSSGQIQLSRTTDGWKITAPIVELADTKVASDFVEGLTFEKSFDLVKEGSSINWKLFGLDPARAVITVTNNANQRISIEVASQKNFNGEFYVRRTGEDKVWTASSSWDVKANKKVLDFRDKRLLKKASAKVEVLEVHQGTQRLRIEKKDDHWRAPEHPEWALDQTKANEVAFMLNNTAAQDIVVDAPVKPADLGRFQLQSPKLSVVLQVRDLGLWRADFSAASKNNEVYVHTTEPDRIVRIQPTDLLKFANLNLDYLRDRRHAFDFVREKVARVEVESQGKTATFHLQDDKWNVEKSSPQASAQNIANVLTAIKATEVVDLAAPEKDLVSLGPKPWSRLVLKTEQGETLIQMEWLPGYDKEMRQTKTKMIFLRSSQEPRKLLGFEDVRLHAWGVEKLWETTPANPAEVSK